jgi:hypothetical protein
MAASIVNSPLSHSVPSSQNVYANSCNTSALRLNLRLIDWLPFHSRRNQLRLTKVMPRKS